MSLQQFLPFGLSVDAAVTALAAGATFVVVVLVWQALLRNDSMSMRARRLERRRQEMRRNRLSARTPNALRRQRATTLMRVVAERLNLLRDRTTARTMEQLACAGWRSADALVAFMIAKLCGPFAFGTAVALWVHVFETIPVQQPLRSFLPLLAVTLGFYAPDLFVRNATEKRQKAIQRGLPDALDLLIICAEAGLSLDAALTRVSHEIERACPEIADELGLTAIELGFLPERRQALHNLVKRCPTPSIRAVVNTLTQTERYGTPLARALRVMSAEFRNERMMKAEEKAARLPVILTIPMVVFILPALFIVLVGPAALKVIDTLKGM